MSDANLSSKFYRNLVFWVGVIATFAYRVIVILNNYSQAWVEIAWYVGTIGFVWYFAHRYRVENKRERLIKEKRLGEKIKNQEQLTPNDRESLMYVLKGLMTSKARWNYIAIFVFSILALAYDIIAKLLNWLT